MAFGFPPKQLLSIPLTSHTPAESLVLARQACAQLGWETSPTDTYLLVANTPLSLRSNGEEITFRISESIGFAQSESLGDKLWDRGQNAANLRQFAQAFTTAAAAVPPEVLFREANALAELLGPLPAEQQEGGEEEQDLLPAHRMGGFRSYFKPVEGYFVTPIIVLLNVLVFGLMVALGTDPILPDGESLLAWGANFKPLTLDGGWWRLLASCFLHIGVLHLVFNMYALVMIGVLLEPFLGRLRFAVAYLLAGLAGSIISLWWHDLSISAGASGAIFGMYGMFLVLLITGVVPAHQRKALLTSMLVFVAYNLVNGLKEGIDNAAHVGGLLGGALIGFGLLYSIRRPELPRLALANTGVVAAVILLLVSGIYHSLPNVFAQYDEAMAAFSINEKRALKIYAEIVEDPLTKEKDYYLNRLEQEGASVWQKNIYLLAKLPPMPSPLDEQVRLLKQYSTLRLNVYRMMQGRIRHYNTAFSPDIKNLNDSIEYILQELQGVPLERRIVLDPGSEKSFPSAVATEDYTASVATPLFLVDGKKRTETEMAYLTEDDVLSMEIIKDAEALLQYGAEGANGVILIKTKKAKQQ